MITITENAKSQVISLLKKEEKDLDHFVRVAVKAGGCSGLSYDLSFDNKKLIIFNGYDFRFFWWNKW